MTKKKSVDTPMLQRAHARMLAGSYENTQMAYEAIHSLIDLRRSGIFLPLIDRVETRIEVWTLGRPAAERLERATDVEDAKVRCMRAGISAEVVDYVFPEPPTAQEALESASGRKICDAPSVAYEQPVRKVGIRERLMVKFELFLNEVDVGLFGPMGQR